jgi:hypothetical protein
MEAIYKKLVQTLEELVVLYRNLFDHLHREKTYLIQADITNLNESNKTKEALLYKIRSIDKERASTAKALAKNIGSEVRLLAIAEKILATHKDESAVLKSLHQTLSLQIARVIELNRDNENYTLSALRILNGAIDDIKQAAGGKKKKTYGKSGQAAATPESQSGNFVSKEA